MTQKTKQAHTIDSDQLYAMRHSLAHIMATAIQELYPGTRFGVGPVLGVAMNGWNTRKDSGLLLN